MFSFYGGFINFLNFNLSLYRDRRNVYTTWEKLGVKGPAASSLFLGNFGETTEKGRYNLFSEWTKKYGKVFGFYEAGTPTLVVADPDLVKEVLVKQFDNFEQRKIIFDNRQDPYANLLEITGEKWKRVRALSSPTFSGKKMKFMSPLVQESINRLMDKFDYRANKNNDFDIFEDFKLLTLDVIASTVFSYDTEVFKKDGSVFYKKLDLFFHNLDPKRMSLPYRYFLLLLTVFPSLETPVKYIFPRITSLKTDWFLDLAKKMIIDRQNSGEFRADYMQLLLNLLKREDDTRDKTFSSDTHSDLSDSESTVHLRYDAENKFLTMEEMQANISIFLIAGYETTAVTLTIIAYYLALYPKVQEKLQAEIDDHFPVTGKNINYETVQKLPYLDMVFCEASRLLYIGGLAVQRMCKETTKIKDITVPKGTRVFINVQDLHMDPEHWGPEPVDEFVPERFAPDRKGARYPMVFLPFGGGPRICVGMRFALMEAKMAVINMLQRYTVVKCNSTKVPLKFTTDGGRTPVDGVFVRLSKK